MADSQAPEPPPAAGTPGIVPIAPGEWWRVHPYDAETARFLPAAFNDSGNGNARFSPLAEGAMTVPVLYAASTLAGALMETVFHDVPFPSHGYLHDLERDLKGPLRASRIRITRPLQLIDLTSIGLQRFELRPSQLFESHKSDYPRTRRWATWLRHAVPAAQGLHWMSRRDTRSEAIVLFGDRIAANAVAEADESLAPFSEPAIESQLLALLSQWAPA